MLSNLLLWTTNQMEGVSVTLGELNLKETLKPVIALQSAIAGEKCIGLKNTIADNAWVVADANMLQLVVRNSGKQCHKIYCSRRRNYHCL